MHGHLCWHDIAMLGMLALPGIRWAWVFLRTRLTIEALANTTEIERGTDMTLTPAFGRDYKTAKAAKADFDAGKDFIVNDFSSPYDGKPANKGSFPKGTLITLRFCELRKVTTVKV